MPPLGPLILWWGVNSGLDACLKALFPGSWFLRLPRCNCSSGELILSVILQTAAHRHHRHPIMTPSPPLHAPRPRQRRAARLEKSPDGGRLLIYYPSLCCQVTLFDSSFTTLPSSPPLSCPHTLICLIRESEPCRLPSLSPEGRSALELCVGQ